MIQAETFIEAARRHGFTRYAGVPCSFLTPFINYVVNDATLHYVSAANEGDAVATAAGAAIGGQRSIAMMQNSGLGNAVSPLASLAWVFRIPLLLITTHRGAPGITDEPQHELMGRITGDVLDCLEIPWENFAVEDTAVATSLERSVRWMEREQRPFGFVMGKDTVAPHALHRKAVQVRGGTRAAVAEFHGNGRGPAKRETILRRIIELTPPACAIVIATTGYSGRELFAIADRPNQFYMVGSMGCASSFGLGLSLARPDLRIVIVDGDGAALMRMGNLATVGSYGGDNLIHIVLDNEAHESTGAQSTVSVNVDFAAIAAACGYRTVARGNDPGLIDYILETERAAAGPRFAHLKIRTGTLDHLPRPSIRPPDALRRLMAHIGSAF